MATTYKAKDIAVFQKQYDKAIASAKTEADLTAFKKTDQYKFFENVLGLNKPATPVAPTPDMPAAPNPNDPFYLAAQGIDPAQKILDSTSTSQGNAAELNQVKGSGPVTYKPTQTGVNAPTSTANTGGSGLSLDAIQGAFQNALRAGSAEANALQRQSIATAIAGNQIQAGLSQDINAMLQNSIAAQQASAQALNSTLASLNSGNKSAQTQFGAVDVSAALEEQQNNRKNLRRAGTAETKQAGILAQKALLAKPTLLGE